MEELLDSLGGSGFINMTRRPLSDSLLELGVSQRFIDEVIEPVMRVNYGQNVSIPAFVGQMSDEMSSRKRGGSEWPLISRKEMEKRKAAAMNFGRVEVRMEERKEKRYRRR